MLSWAVSCLASTITESQCEVWDQAVVNKVADTLFSSDAGPGLAVLQLERDYGDDLRQESVLIRYNDCFTEVLASGGPLQPNPAERDISEVRLALKEQLMDGLKQMTQIDAGDEHEPLNVLELITKKLGE